MSNMEKKWEQTEIVRIPLWDDDSIVVKINKIQGKPYQWIDIRKHIKRGPFTGFSKSGVMFPEKVAREVIQGLEKAVNALDEAKKKTNPETLI